MREAMNGLPGSGEARRATLRPGTAAMPARPTLGHLGDGLPRASLFNQMGTAGQLAPPPIPAPPISAPRIPRPPRVQRTPRPSLPAQQSLDFSASAASAPSLPSVSSRTPAPTIPTRPKRPSPQASAPTATAPSAGLGGMASASVFPGRQISPYAPPQTATTEDPDVYLIALATPGGGLHALEGAGRGGAIRVGRPFGHLRSVRPIMPIEVLAGVESDALAAAAEAPRTRRSRGLGSSALAPEAARASGSTKLPAERPKPQIVSAVEVETDAGIFRVERPHGVLGHMDLAWALANLEAGEPDSLVPLPRRQLALLLTLLPTPDDPEHPEQDAQWGWAHRLKAPWERGPLHPRGRLGRLIAVDPDLSSRGMHRACFEVLGTEEVVWALGVPCYRTGSVYELTPLRRGLGGASRWLSWPLTKGRGGVERPDWEIARVVYRVGAPRWPLAGVVEPLGPLGVAG